MQECECNKNTLGYIVMLGRARCEDKEEIAIDLPPPRSPSQDSALSVCHRALKSALSVCQQKEVNGTKFTLKYS